MSEQQTGPHDHEKQEPAAGMPWRADEQVGDIYQMELSDQPDQPEDHERAEEDRPRIWVGSWLDYNHAVLHGEWIPADREDAEVWADIEAMLARSPIAKKHGDVAEDWGIFDYENFGPLRVGEQESVAWVAKVARGITEHGLAFAAYAEVMEEESQLDGFADDYLGHYDSMDAYAEQLIDDSGYPELLDKALPESIRSYAHIDTAALARDMQFSGDMHVIRAEDDGVWIFRA